MCLDASACSMDSADCLHGFDGESAWCSSLTFAGKVSCVQSASCTVSFSANSHACIFTRPAVVYDEIFFQMNVRGVHLTTILSNSMLACVFAGDKTLSTTDSLARCFID